MCKEMVSKALPGHALSKEWEQRDSTVCRRTVCSSLWMGLCSHFGCFESYINKKKQTRKHRLHFVNEMKGVWLYIHAPKQKAQARKTQKFKPITGGSTSIFFFIFFKIGLNSLRQLYSFFFLSFFPFF